MWPSFRPQAFAATHSAYAAFVTSVRSRSERRKSDEVSRMFVLLPDPIRSHREGAGRNEQHIGRRSTAILNVDVGVVVVGDGSDATRRGSRSRSRSRPRSRPRPRPWSSSAPAESYRSPALPGGATLSSPSPALSACAGRSSSGKRRSAAGIRARLFRAGHAWPRARRYRRPVALALDATSPRDLRILCVGLRGKAASVRGRAHGAPREDAAHGRKRMRAMTLRGAEGAHDGHPRALSTKRLRGVHAMHS